MKANPKMTDLFGDQFQAHKAALSPAARRVAAFIEQNRMMVLASSAAELAACTGTSDATIVRTVQALGFTGLPELKQALLACTTTGTTTLADHLRHTLAVVGETTDQAVDMVLATHTEALNALMQPEARRQMTKAVAKLHPAQRIIVFGIGPSAALASYMVTLLERAGRQSKCLNYTGSMLADQLLDLRHGDAVLVMAYGRTYREVTTLLSEARQLNLPIILVTDKADGPLAKAANVVLTVQRGRTDQVALHGTTLIALEAIILGLAATHRHQAVAALERLNRLRHSLIGQNNHDD